MTERKLTEYDEYGRRLYLVNGERYMGVTSILGSVKKPQLERAKVRRFAEHAARIRRDLADYTRAPDAKARLLADWSDRDGVAFRDWHVKREAGTRAHQAIEASLTGQPVDFESTEDPEFWAINGLESWLEEVGAEVVDWEQTVIHPGYGYGGSYDLVIRMPDGRLILVDTKTNARGPSPDAAMQNELYRRAKLRVLPDGSTVPMHDISGTGVLWIRPEGYGFFPVTDNELAWRLAYARLLCYDESQTIDLIGDPVAGNLGRPFQY